MLLIISKSKAEATALSDMLNIMGILAYPETPTGGLSEINLSYRAVLLMSPDSLPDPSDYIKRIRSYHKSIPVFAISDSNNRYGIIDKTFAKNTKAAEIIKEIIAFQKESGLAPIGEYRFAGILAESDSPLVRYFDKRLPLTKTETMIVRYLIRLYPAPQDSKAIISHAFRQSRAPMETSARTFVSLINKKFRIITGRNLIIHYPSEGYVILTPEIIAEGKIL